MTNRPICFQPSLGTRSDQGIVDGEEVCGSLKNKIHLNVQIKLQPLKIHQAKWQSITKQKHWAQSEQEPDAMLVMMAHLPQGRYTLDYYPTTHYVIVCLLTAEQLFVMHRAAIWSCDLGISGVPLSFQDAVPTFKRCFWWHGWLEDRKIQLLRLAAHQTILSK